MEMFLNKRSNFHMNSDALRQDSYSQADLNDNFISRELQYASILKISMFTRLKEYLCIYMAKVHASAGVPSLVGYIYLTILCIDSTFPSFLIDAKDLWPRDSILSSILLILSYIWAGPPYDVERLRVNFSFLIFWVYMIAIVGLVIRASIYQKYKRINNVETMIVVIIYKFILPLLVPNLMVGIPMAYYKLIVKRIIGVNLFVAILNPIMLILFLKLLHQVFVPRVVFEDVPTHEWLPVTATATILNAGVVGMVSTIPSFTHGYGRMGASIYIFIEELLGGILIFYVTPTPRRYTSLLTAILTFAGAYSSLFMTIQLAMKPVKPEIFLFSLIFVAILISVIVIYINKKMVAKVLSFIDKCQDANDPEIEKELMDREFPNSYSFWGKMRTVIEYWHPYLVTWKLFNYSLERWPNNFNVLLLYGRLLSFFPNHNDKMIWITSLLARIENISSRTSYLLQFKHIARTRQTTLSIALKKEIDLLNSKVEILTALFRRFWENILQKNVSSLWEDSEKINHTINELDSMFCQLIEDYPNNPHAIESYMDFAKKVHHDSAKIKEIEDQLDIVKKYGKIRTDLPMTIAIRVYPNIQVYMTDMMDNKGMDENLDLPSESSITEDNEKVNDNQLYYALQDTIKHSKLGRVWINFILIIVMTSICVGLFLFYNSSYTNLFLEKQKYALNFISLISRAEYEFNNLRMVLTVYPLFKQGNPPFDDLDNLMNIVAPNLYTKYHILPKWIINEERMKRRIYKSKEHFSKMFKALTDLDQKNEDVKAIAKVLVEDEVADGKNFQLVLSQMILDAMALTNTSTTRPYEFYNTYEYKRFTRYYHHQIKPVKESLNISLDYAESDFESSYTSLNIIMVFAGLTTLTLVTLPFMLQLFRLHVQSNAIADSFTLFPNTEIRRVINTFGSIVSKYEDDITHVAQLSRGSSFATMENIKLTIPFVISFVPMTASCLFIYYSAQNFQEIAESNAEIIYQLISPFSQYVDVMTLIVRIYDIDQDTSSYNSSLKEIFLNLSYLTLNEAVRSMNEAIWGNYSSSSKYYELGHFDGNMYPDELPLNLNELPGPRSIFEKMTTYDFPQTTDFMAMYFRKILSLARDRIEPSNEVFLNMLLYFTNFSILQRNELYFEIIENSVFDTIDRYVIAGRINITTAVVFQIVAAILMMLHMWDQHSIIINALRFYFFLTPGIILQNHTAMNLIESGKRSQDESKANFVNADLILAKMNQCITIINKELNIIDYNAAFLNALMIKNDRNYIGEPLISIFESEDQDRSFTEFIQKIKEALNGRHTPEFSQNVIIKTHTGKKIYFLASTVSLTAHNTTAEGDQKEIEFMAIILDDCTDTYLKIEILEHEQAKIKRMLENVYPGPVINDLEGSEERISFVVQSSTIGQIQIHTAKQWNYQTHEPFEFYNSVFESFDKVLSDFKLLYKVRTFGSTYIYTGGLFSQINKPEKHADQAVRFAIKILNAKYELSRKLGVDIDMTAGIHTGGPIIAGVMNIKRPNFQIIGTVMELAEQMKATGITGQVQITRSVYELIFSSGFKVAERGEIKIKGGNTLTTYLVIP